MGKRDRIKGILLVVFFLVTTYFVSYGIAGSSVVAEYNGGFGTFDMKDYTPALVNEVLSNTSQHGFTVYKWYYLFDVLFVIEFLLFQIFFSFKLFYWWDYKYAKVILCVIPILRALFDSIENVLLLTTLYDYPNVSDAKVTIASFFTHCKLWANKLWYLIAVIGIICVIIKRKSTNSVRKKVENG